VATRKFCKTLVEAARFRGGVLLALAGRRRNTMKRRMLSIVAAALLAGCATARAPAGPPRIHGSAPERIAALREHNKDAQVVEDRFATEQARDLRARDAAARAERRRRVEVMPEAKKNASGAVVPAPARPATTPSK